MSVAKPASSTVTPHPSQTVNSHHHHVHPSQNAHDINYATLMPNSLTAKLKLPYSFKKIQKFYENAGGPGGNKNHLKESLLAAEAVAANNMNSEKISNMLNPNPMPYQCNQFKPSTTTKLVEITKRTTDGFSSYIQENIIHKPKGIILHTDRFWSLDKRNYKSTQQERLRAEKEFLERAKELKRQSEILSHRNKYNLLLGGEKLPTKLESCEKGKNGGSSAAAMNRKREEQTVAKHHSSNGPVFKLEPIYTNNMAAARAQQPSVAESVSGSALPQQFQSPLPPAAPSNVPVTTGGPTSSRPVQLANQGAGSSATTGRGQFAAPDATSHSSANIHAALNQTARSSTHGGYDDFGFQHQHLQHLYNDPGSLTSSTTHDMAPNSAAATVAAHLTTPISMGIQKLILKTRHEGDAMGMPGGVGAGVGAAPGTGGFLPSMSGSAPHPPAPPPSSFIDRSLLSQSNKQPPPPPTQSTASATAAFRFANPIGSVGGGGDGSNPRGSLPSLTGGATTSSIGLESSSLDFETAFNQSERLQPSKVTQQRFKEYKLDGHQVIMNERHDIQQEIRYLKSIILPEVARDLFIGRGINMPSNHITVKPRPVPERRTNAQSGGGRTGGNETAVFNSSEPHSAASTVTNATGAGKRAYGVDVVSASGSKFHIKPAISPERGNSRENPANTATSLSQAIAPHTETHPDDTNKKHENSMVLQEPVAAPANQQEADNTDHTDANTADDLIGQTRRRFVHDLKLCVAAESDLQPQLVQSLSDAFEASPFRDSTTTPENASSSRNWLNEQLNSNNTATPNQQIYVECICNVILGDPDATASSVNLDVTLYVSIMLIAHKITLLNSPFKEPFESLDKDRLPALIAKFLAEFHARDPQMSGSISYAAFEHLIRQHQTIVSAAKQEAEEKETAPPQTDQLCDLIKSSVTIYYTAAQQLQEGEEPTQVGKLDFLALLPFVASAIGGGA